MKQKEDYQKIMRDNKSKKFGEYLVVDKMEKRTYITFPSPSSVSSIDRNFKDPKNVSQMPKGLYKKEPLVTSKTQPLFYKEAGALPYPRDTSIDYIMYLSKDSNGKTIESHPEHFSRFGYPWFPNGYGTGNFPGRYNTPPSMMWMSNMWPEDMAPKRFYEGKHRDPNYCNSEAYINAKQARSNR